MSGMVGEGFEQWHRTRSIDSCLDLLLEAVAPLGFNAVVYDFAPVPLTHDGRMIRPNLMRGRGLPRDFVELWCDRSYYRIDPVQQICTSSNMPFIWSLADGRRQILGRPILPEHQPAVSYLRDTRLTCGATVPIHLPAGGLANVTAIRRDAEDDFADDARRGLGELILLAHAMNEAACASFDDRIRRCTAIPVTEREVECLGWAARGKTAQDIARILGRSVATVSLHLNNAQRKLGAKNRAQAIARAAHYRLLGPRL
ncbi:MAG: LuxR family transcriptional regulator, quorum-sensing system regulator SdiA [Rhodospirillaceae bacterium]|jgi:LuxR family transcriptional regulator|nr:LuxR family transcriptional regulator, quorum-sensing system regulator SdiA [Rhodospirillaceae bacterium]